MAINLATMLINRHIFKILILILSILGAILGIIQVAFGVLVIYNQLGFCCLNKTKKNRNREKKCLVIE